MVDMLSFGAKLAGVSSLQAFIMKRLENGDEPLSKRFCQWQFAKKMLDLEILRSPTELCELFFKETACFEKAFKTDHGHIRNTWKDIPRKHEEICLAIKENREKEQKHLLEENKQQHLLRKEIVSLQKRLHPVVQESVKLDSKRKDALQHKEILEKQLEDMFAKLDIVNKAVSEKEAKKQVTSKKREKSLSYFSEQLGLKFKRDEANKELAFIFTQINPDEPERQYVFFIKLESNTYRVTSCNPHISNMDELVNKLNSTNNLAGFVAAVRKRFKEMV